MGEDAHQPATNLETYLTFGDVAHVSGSILGKGYDWGGGPCTYNNKMDGVSYLRRSQ